MSYTTKQYLAKISELTQQLITTLASLAEMRGERDTLQKEVDFLRELLKKHLSD
jgi:hypothetical protein